MLDAIAAVGGPPIFERPLQIVRPVFPDVGKFLAPFQAALASGQVTNGGRWVMEFESQLSEYLGVPTLVFCNGQLALMTMLRAFSNIFFRLAVELFGSPALGVDDLSSCKRHLEIVGFGQTTAGDHRFFSNRLH